MKLDVPAPCTTYRLTNPPESKDSSVLASLIGATQMPQYFPETLRIRSMEDDLKFRYNNTSWTWDTVETRGSAKGFMLGLRVEKTRLYAWGDNLPVAAQQVRHKVRTGQYTRFNPVVEGQPNLDAPLARLNVSLQYKARPQMTLTGGWSATLQLFWDLFQVETGGWPVEFREPCDRVIVAAMVTAMQLAS
ncbi:hypothetical protein B0H16DRAFT_1459488 [Mycena metata]|uniref:Uncharacterized protein n=1 Tax=Mycena metata TaxID=1033252 RepID=A0AAD7J2M2_9AGAR|nr:hypothetical protein B0H16DRAFT_1459488 [Mycena metata]